MGSCSSKASAISSPVEAKKPLGSWQSLDGSKTASPTVTVDDQTADRLKSNGTSEPTGRVATEKVDKAPGTELARTPNSNGNENGKSSFAASFLGGVRKGANAMYNMHSHITTSPTRTNGSSSTLTATTSQPQEAPPSNGGVSDNTTVEKPIEVLEDDPDSKEPQDLLSRRNKQKNNSRLVIFPPNSDQLATQNSPAANGKATAHTNAAASLAMLPGSIATPKTTTDTPTKAKKEDLTLVLEDELPELRELPSAGSQETTRPSSHQNAQRSLMSPVSSKPGSAPSSPAGKRRVAPKSPRNLEPKPKSPVSLSVVSARLSTLKKKRLSVPDRATSAEGSEKGVHSSGVSRRGSTSGYSQVSAESEGEAGAAGGGGAKYDDEDLASVVDHAGPRGQDSEDFNDSEDEDGYDPYYGFDVGTQHLEESEEFGVEGEEEDESGAPSEQGEEEEGELEEEEASTVICPPRDTPNVTGWDGGFDGMTRPTSARPSVDHSRSLSSSNNFKVSDTELQILRQRHAEVQMLLRLDLTNVFAINHAHKVIERLHDFLQDVQMTASHLNVEPQAVYQHLLQRIAAETNFYGMGVDASLMSRPEAWDEMLRMADMLAQLHGRAEDTEAMASMMGCAMELRQVIRIKVQDNNDLRTAGRALEDALDFFTVFAMVNDQIQQQILSVF